MPQFFPYREVLHSWPSSRQSEIQCHDGPNNAAFRFPTAFGSWEIKKNERHTSLLSENSRMNKAYKPFIESMNQRMFLAKGHRVSIKLTQLLGHCQAARSIVALLINTDSTYRLRTNLYLQRVIFILIYPNDFFIPRDMPRCFSARCRPIS